MGPNGSDATGLSFYETGATPLFACQADQRFRHCLYVPKTYQPQGTRRSLSGAQPKVVASVVTAQGATTGALDPQTGRVYLPVGRAPATNFGGRAAPGFAVLVVGQR